MELDSEKFDEFVDEVLGKFPKEIKEQIENIAIVVEPDPNPKQLRSMKIKGLLLGLFEGVPKTVWGQSIAPIIPNKITIFRNPILKVSRTLKDLKITVHVVVMHEIAHYFGYNDNDMFIMDRKLRAKLLKEIE